MFTGIVEGQGTVVSLQRRGGGARLVVQAGDLCSDLKIGDSVAVNGACVTVTECDGERFACDLVPETVARTNLGILHADERVNLERPVRAVDRLGGHIVQGHVDVVGVVRSRRRVGAQELLEITVPFELTRYLAPQGSVALDGVSLTVVAVDRDRFRVALIPHTVAATSLGEKVQGAPVNVEVDVISKYVERHMQARAARPAGIFDEAALREPEPALRPPAKQHAAAVRQPAKAPAKTAAKASPKPAAKVAKKPAATSTGSSARAASANGAKKKATATKRTVPDAAKRRR